MISNSPLGMGLLIPQLDAYMDRLNLGWISTIINIVLVFVLARILTQLAGRILRQICKRSTLRLNQDDTAIRRMETCVTLCQALPSMYFISSPRPSPLASWALPPLWPACWLLPASAPWPWALAPKA